VGSAGRNSNEFKIKSHSNLVRSKTDLPGLKKFESKYGEIGFQGRNNFCYCNFPKFKLKYELKFRKDKSYLNLWINLKYLEVLENYQTWHKIILLHLVAFKIISMVYCFIVFESFFGALIELISG
jgi:hypothetical protein